MKILAVAALTVLFATAFVPVVMALPPPPNGTLFMYTDNTCTTLLPQMTTGIKGYILPPTGTVIGIEVQNIPSTQTGITDIQLNFNNGTTSFSVVLAATVTAGSTDCVSWTVGNFTGATGVSLGCGITGVVFYGTTDHTNEFQTVSNGGSDGGHFLGSGTGTDGNCLSTTTTTTSGSTTETSTSSTGGCTENCPPPPQVPEFPLGSLAVIALLAPLLFLMRKSLVRVPARLFR